MAQGTLGGTGRSGNNDKTKYCVRKYFTLKAPGGHNRIEITVCPNEIMFAHLCCSCPCLQDGAVPELLLWAHLIRLPAGVTRDKY